MRKAVYSNILQPVLCLVAISGLLVSCTHYHYTPNTNNVPLLKSKGEGKINANYYSTDEADGGELQGAFAIGKHTGIMVNVLSAGSDHSISSEFYDEEYGRGYYAEAGVGYFTPVNNSKWIFETYTGFGIGSIKNGYSNSETARTGIKKIFVQPSIGYAGKGLEFALSSKLSWVNLNIRNSTVTAANNWADLLPINYIRENPSSILWEPGIMIRGGFKGLMITANYTASVNLLEAWQQENYAFGLGLSIPFKLKPKANEK